MQTKPYQTGNLFQVFTGFYWVKLTVLFNSRFHLKGHTLRFHLQTKLKVKINFVRRNEQDYWKVLLN